MVRIAFILGLLVFAATFGATQVSADAGTGDGHGFSWFRDADGDGIPNGMDPDWFPPEDGTGYRLKHQFGLLGVGTFLRAGDGQNAYNQQYRHRRNQGDAAADCLRIRQQLRDGSCK